MHRAGSSLHERCVPAAPATRWVGRRSRRGFALAAALWLLVALSAVGLELGLQARARRLAVSNTLDIARAPGAALGALAETHAHLAYALRRATTSPSGTGVLRLDPWREPDRLVQDTLTLGDAHARAQLLDVGARLNLNLATEEELRRLFTVLRIDAGEADRLAQAIADWRDGDDLHRTRGAERAEYLEAGAPVLPANRPFHSLAELTSVRGMTRELYDRVSPHLVTLGTGRVNLNAASRPVLLALPGMTEEAVAVLRERATGAAKYITPRARRSRIRCCCTRCCGGPRRRATWMAAAVGGWKNVETLLRRYSKADRSTMLAVLQEGRKVRDGDFAGQLGSGPRTG